MLAYRVVNVYPYERIALEFENINSQTEQIAIICLDFRLKSTKWLREGELRKSKNKNWKRERYKSEIDKFYWGKAKLWHDSKCIVSCGGAPLKIVKRYIWQVRVGDSSVSFC